MTPDSGSFGTGALLLEQNDEWAVGRRYMSLETLTPVGHSHPVRLPAVAA